MTEFIHPFAKRDYFEQALFLYIRYSKYLDDDYAICESSILEYFVDLINRLSPYFWVIVEGNEVSGIVYLDNIIGRRDDFHSAEIVTCFKKKFWGAYTVKCARDFLNYCFIKLNLKKIKALIYPENFRVKPLLKKLGFVNEALLKHETLKNGKFQDIEVYSLFKSER